MRTQIRLLCGPFVALIIRKLHFVYIVFLLAEFLYPFLSSDCCFYLFATFHRIVC